MARKKKKTTDKDIQEILSNPRNRVILAIILAVSAVFLLVSFTSFLGTWQTDISKKNLGLGDLFDPSVTFVNAGGKLGGLLSVIFINRWFGLAAYGIVFILSISALQLIRPIKKYKTMVFHSLFIMIWTSLTLGYLFEDASFNLGGSFGILGIEYIRSLVGYVGTFLVIFITWLIYIFLTVDNSLAWTEKQISKIKVVGLKNFLLAIVNFLQSFFKKGDAQQDKPASDDEDSIYTGAAEQASPEKPAEKKGIFRSKQKLNPFDEVTQTPVNKFVIGDNKEGDDDFEIDMSALKQEQQPAAENMQVQSELDKAVKEGEKLNPGMAMVVERAEEFTVDEVQQDYDPIRSLAHYQFPPVSLLEDYRSDIDEVALKKELKEKKEKIINTLKHFNIEITKIQAKVGPTVTLYEIVPKLGVRSSKIKNLEDDIALSLAAEGIRIISPMPGRGTIGIEVPNKKPAIVSLKSVLLSPEFQKNKFELPIALGRNTVNEPFVFDLAKAPHLLIAGATGQGKSVAVNVMINSLLFKKHPALVKFVLIDPKQVELAPYNKLMNHFLAKLPNIDDAIITDVKYARHVLASLTQEMDDRYQLLVKAQVRNIKEYNDKFIKRKLSPSKGHRFLPYIVVVIDEFADLIMTAGKEIEHPIARLAQKARAIGIHLIVATQRPDTTVITGMIKANFPTRIALKTSQAVDSKIIIDQPGANKLIGRGDMLYSAGAKLTRLQSAFIDIDEIDRVTEFISEQPGYPAPFELPEPILDDEEDKAPGQADLRKRDDLFDDAAYIVVANQIGSTSMLQRKMEIGFARAGRIMDQLEAAGIVGPSRGSKAREVYVKDLDELEVILQGIKQKYNS